MNTIIVGLQWGDEGKGKIVDYLTEDADIVVRGQGGNNAGHTVIAKGVRNSPSAFDAAFLSTQFWDGRAATLEEQAKGPIVNPVEMALPNEAAAEAKLQKLSEYAPLFEAAFGDELHVAASVGAAAKNSSPKPSSPPRVTS